MRYLDADQRKRHRFQTHTAPSPTKMNPQESPTKITPQVSPRNEKKFDGDLGSQTPNLSYNKFHDRMKTPASSRRLSQSFTVDSVRVIGTTSSPQLRIQPTRLFNTGSTTSRQQENKRGSFVLWIISITFVVSTYIVHETNRPTYDSLLLRSTRPQQWTETIEIQSTVKITRQYPNEREYNPSDSSRTRLEAMKYHPRITHINHQNVQYLKRIPPKRRIQIYPADFSDNTQLYGTHDSNDPALSKMERRTPLDNGSCVPMKAWQRAYLPVCNTLHEFDLAPSMDQSREQNINLFGLKGYFRNAWKLDRLGTKTNETVVLKTLRYV